MPLFVVEIAYQVIQTKTTKTELQHLALEDDDSYFSHIWEASLSGNFDALDVVFPFNESIMEAINLVEQP